MCADNLWNKEAIDKIEEKLRNSTISVRDFNTLSQQLKWQQNNIQLKELKKSVKINMTWKTADHFDIVFDKHNIL